MHLPAWGLIRDNENREMVTRGAKLGLCSETHQISVHTKNQLGWVDGIAGGGIRNNHIYLISLIIWPLQGQNLANVAPRRLSCKHEPNKCRP